MDKGDKFFPGQKPVDFEVNRSGIFIEDILSQKFDVASRKIQSGEIVVDDELRQNLEVLAEADSLKEGVKSFIQELLDHHKPAQV